MAFSSSRKSLLPRVRLFSTTPPSSPSPSISLSSAKSKLRAEHDPDKALSIFSSITRLTSSTPISFCYALDLTVKRLSKSRRFSDIENLIESQKTHNPNITQEPFLSSLILSYGRAGMLDHAHRTFDQTDALGAPRSAASFNALLAACIHSQEFHRVPDLFSELPNKYGINPDKMSYGILIKSLCEMGSPESALNTLKDMEEKNVEITTIAYTTVVDAFYKKGKTEEAEEVWKKMLEKGRSLDAAAYNVKLRHTHQGKPEQVLKLMEEMAASGVKPDIISYNYLLKCHFTNNQVEDAKRIYKGLWESGSRPNTSTFKLMVRCLCENGDFDYALKVFKSAVKRNKIPDFRTVRSLLEGLAKSSKTKEAKALTEVIRKNFPQSFSAAWDKVEAELGIKEAEEGSAEVAVPA